MTSEQHHGDDVVDALPDDLDARAFAGAYRFPDNSRRRVPAGIYLALGIASIAVAQLSSAKVNGGLTVAGIGLVAFGLFGLLTGGSMSVDERAALAHAQQAVGFPIGHASAQQVWHGLTSRPTWRVLAYSAEEPPRRRALVLVDAMNGAVIEHMVEDNPEWAER